MQINHQSKNEHIMKKLLILLALVAISIQQTKAQSLDHLIKKASKINDVEQIKIGGFLLSVGRMFASNSDMPSISKNIKKIEILNFSNCSNNDRNEISSVIKKMNSDDNQDVLIQIKDKGDYVKIISKKNKNEISELAILVANQNDPTIIRLIGKITQKDIDQLINEYNK
jgi:hypothetical protein